MKPKLDTFAIMLIVVILFLLMIGAFVELAKAQMGQPCNQRCNDFNSRLMSVQWYGEFTFACRCEDQNGKIDDYKITR
jgi:hypothetical protein